MDIRDQKLVPPPTNRGVSFPSPSGVSPTVDWITATTFDTRISLYWQEIFASVIAENSYVGTKPWSFHGYTGWHCPGAMFGYRSYDEGAILIITSDRADKYWGYVARGEASVTRLDLAVTVELPAQVIGLPMAHYSAAGEGGIRKNTVITNKKGGQTFYIGSRSSIQYGRVYDKGAEQGKDPGWRYRYEVVVKKGLTPNLVKSLIQANDNGRARLIQSFVWDWFDNREVTPIFSRGYDKAIRLEAEVKISTPHKKLTWLRKQVRNTIDDLIDAGYSDEVIASLFG